MFPIEEVSQEYWDKRWENEETGWDLGGVSPPIQAYFDQFTNKEINILIPGCGNAHEAEYLYQLGFKNLTLLDISPNACQKIAARFPYESVKVVCEDFFEHEGSYDIIVEQTFFCALPPELRIRYAEKMKSLLAPNGKLVGVLFNRDFGNPFPPFGGSIEEYQAIFEKFFEVKILEVCKNSAAPRCNTEVFFVVQNSK